MSEIPPWQGTVQEINAATENLFSKVYQICDDMGFKDSAVKSYYTQARDHLMGLIKDLVEDLETKKKNLQEAVELLIEEVNTLSNELKIDPGVRNFTNEPLIDVQTTLRTQIQDLKQIKEQRLNYLEELLEKESEICKSMGVQRIGTSDNLLSSEELENFKIYLERQEAEKNRLENAFKEMRRSIMKMLDELSITPALEFEYLVCNNPEDFVYTANNMLKLRKMRDNLKDHLDEAKKKAASKREELMDLWKCLELPEDFCQDFLDNHSGHSIKDIHALNGEIERCKQLRSENVARYVEKVREQLKNLWDMCRFDDAQRSKFKPFYIQTYTEDLLTVHTLEVQKLREYYDRNRKIYELLDERETMWEKGKELDQRANDPERLHNRGGQLLAEEKERRIIQKKLPKIDEKLRELIEEYEAKNNEPFTIDGKSYSDFLTQSWENYLEMKESLKKARAKAKDKPMKKTPIMSTSRRTPATAGSLLKSGYTSAKKRDDRSPRAVSNTRRLVSSDKIRPTTLSSRVRRSGRLPRRLLAVSKAANTSNRSPKKPETLNETQNTIGSISHYEQFQQHLQNRDELRSSMLPEQVLKTVRSKSQMKMRTPVKTPLKPLRKNTSTVNTPNKTPKSSHSRETSRSPRLLSTPRLAPTSNNMPIFF